MIAKSPLGTGANNQNGNLRWYLPLGVDPPQWAKSGGEAVLLQFSDFTKDPMHDFNRLFC